MAWASEASARPGSAWVRTGDCRGIAVRPSQRRGDACHPAGELPELLLRGGHRHRVEQNGLERRVAPASEGSATAGLATSSAAASPNWLA